MSDIKIKWRDHFSQRTVVEEYYIGIRTQHDRLAYKVSYVRHNGYTTIEPSIAFPVMELSQSAKDFNEWLKLRSDLNTRYDLPHWWKRIRFGRKKKLVSWGVRAIDKAYSTWHQEKYQQMIDKPQSVC